MCASNREGNRTMLDGEMEREESIYLNGSLFCYLLVSCHVSLEFGNCCYFLCYAVVDVTSGLLLVSKHGIKIATNTQHKTVDCPFAPTYVMLKFVDCVVRMNYHPLFCSPFRCHIISHENSRIRALYWIKCTFKMYMPMWIHSSLSSSPSSSSAIHIHKPREQLTHIHTQRVKTHKGNK